MDTQIALDEVVLEDLITSRGLRTVHIMQHGRPRNDFAWAQKWIEARVPDHAREFATWCVQPDANQALDYWHLSVWWNARQMVEFVPGRWEGAALRYGVLWYIPQGKETVSFAVDVAATLYRQTTGRTATHAWLRDEPVSKRATIQAQDGPIALATGCVWVPQRYVVVGIPQEIWDAKIMGGRYV